jgi:hypothetical protein
VAKTGILPGPDITCVPNAYDGFGSSSLAPATACVPHLTTNDNVIFSLLGSISYDGLHAVLVAVPSYEWDFRT